VLGTPFGRYRLIELLGRGGQGEVWRAYDTATNNRVVAIKVLLPHLAADDIYAKRFRREAEEAARLNNPHIIPIHNYGEIDGRLYLDMRLIEGRSLHEVLAAGPLEPARAVRIIEQVAKALHAAHKIDLVHRDVKPNNILLDEDDNAYLIDFGIARGAEQTSLTTGGGPIGTPHYISPERWRAGQLDARSDVYALACVLYECLTGRTPFPGNSAEQQITAHLMTPPPRPSHTDPNVPASFDPVIAAGMAKHPDQRYATAVELANAAQHALTIDPAPEPEPEPEPERQQRDDLNQAETQLDPVIWPLVDPEPEPVDDRSATDATTAPRRRWWRRGTVVIPGILVVVAVTAAGVYWTRPQPHPVPPVAAAALNGLLLSPADVSTAMGTTGMMVAAAWTQIQNHIPVTPAQCQPINTVIEPQLYAGSGWTTMRGQKINSANVITQSVVQGVVLFPTASQAAALVNAASRSWSACADGAYSFSVKGVAEQWMTGTVSTTIGTLNVTTTEQNAKGWACQRALAARNNVVIDVVACGYHTTDQGISIAGQIAAKIPE
jgi:serine/threonine kinase PknH